VVELISDFAISSLPGLSGLGIQSREQLGLHAGCRALEPWPEQPDLYGGRGSASFRRDVISSHSRNIVIVTAAVNHKFGGWGSDRRFR